MPRGWWGPKPEDWKAAIAARLRGRRKTDNHRTAIGDAQRGKKRGPYKKKPKPDSDSET